MDGRLHERPLWVESGRGKIFQLLFYCAATPKLCYAPTVDAGREIDMHHGAIEVVAYQETLLLMAAFGVAVLAIGWTAFRRWLQSRERMGRLIAEQTAQSSVQHDAQMERIESRLKTIEQIVTGDGAQPRAQIENLTCATDDQISTGDQMRGKLQ